MRIIIIALLFCATIATAEPTPKLVRVTGTEQADGIYTFALEIEAGAFWRCGDFVLVHKYTGAGWYITNLSKSGILYICQDSKPYHLPPRYGWTNLSTGESVDMRVKVGGGVK